MYVYTKKCILGQSAKRYDFEFRKRICFEITDTSIQLKRRWKFVKFTNLVNLTCTFD